MPASRPTCGQIAQPGPWAGRLEIGARRPVLPRAGEQERCPLRGQGEPAEAEPGRGQQQGDRTRDRQAEPQRAPCPAVTGDRQQHRRHHQPHGQEQMGAMEGDRQQIERQHRAPLDPGQGRPGECQHRHRQDHQPGIEVGHQIAGEPGQRRQQRHPGHHRDPPPGRHAEQARQEQLHRGGGDQRIKQRQQPEAAAGGEAPAQEAPGGRADRRVARQHPPGGADPAGGRLGRRRPEAGPAQQQLRVGLALQEIAVGVPEQIGVPVEHRRPGQQDRTDQHDDDAGSMRGVDRGQSGFRTRHA